MSPMKELLSTQMPLHLTRLPLPLPMLVRKPHDREDTKDTPDKLINTSTLSNTNTQDRHRLFNLFIHIYLL